MAAAPYFNRSKTDLWNTPPGLLAEITGGESFFDPCPESPTFNGLAIPWSTTQLNFVNPPYSELRYWCKKATEESLLGCRIALLMPARVSAQYFHKWVLPFCREIRFVRGRRRFIVQETKELAEHAAPLDLIVVYYGPTREQVQSPQHGDGADHASSGTLSPALSDLSLGS